MSKIEYKTRGNSSPQGKPRVFVFYHQEDAVDKGGNQSFFDLVCADILAAQNCAIYYESDWTKPTDEEELMSLLSEMQLLVMVISTNFLFRNDPKIIRAIYNIAEANHTPILPIAVEYGIEQVFAEQMNSILLGAGDIQFLDRTANDLTKIPYKEQLEKYLNSVIVGDELASRVRAAFDAYIFMSYRKKDRLYAQQLMRVIHNIPFCRDIAIWYDEYLTPGEAWSDAIKEAMTKSSLVTLAVTPSLAEPNYIATHEYPYAKDLQKDIIPAEVRKTNRALLERLFKDLPEFVDGTDVNAMTDRLQQLAITANDESPEHNFLIGLAYLNAIDVERDTQRAFQLIKSSADANLPEAIHKLVDMYNTGEGVQRDYEEAIDWQKKYIAVIEELGYSQQKIVNAYRALGKMEQNVGNLSAAIKYYKIDYDFSKQLMEETNTIDSRLEVSTCCNMLGHILQDEGKLSEAKEYIVMGLQIRKSIAEKMNTIGARQNLATSYGFLSDIIKEEGDLSAAKEYLLKGVQILEQIAKEAKTSQAQSDLAVCYERLGDIAEEEVNKFAAKEYFTKCLQIFEQITAEDNTIEAQRNMAISYDKLGKIEKSLKRYTTAKEYCTKSLQIIKHIADETNTFRAQIDLAYSYKGLGDVAKEEGNLFVAKEYYTMSLQISKQIVEETNAVEARSDLAKSYNKLGKIALEEGNLSTAKEYITMGLQICKSVAEKTNTIGAQKSVAVNYGILSDIVKEEGNLSIAKEYLFKCLSIFEQIANKTDTYDSRRNIIVTYNRLRSIAFAEGDYANAHQYYEKVMQLLDMIAAKYT